MNLKLVKHVILRDFEDPIILKLTEPLTEDFLSIKERGKCLLMEMNAFYTDKYRHLIKKKESYSLTLLINEEPGQYRITISENTLSALYVKYFKGTKIEEVVEWLLEE